MAAGLEGPLWVRRTSFASRWEHRCCCLLGRLWACVSFTCSSANDARELQQNFKVDRAVSFCSFFRRWETRSTQLFSTILLGSKKLPAASCACKIEVSQTSKATSAYFDFFSTANLSSALIIQNTNLNSAPKPSCNLINLKCNLIATSFSKLYSPPRV